MARSSALASLCALAAISCVLLQCSRTFVGTPANRVEVAAGAVAAASIPGVAGAFVYDGKEYFDITFGISPLAWAFTAFAILVYGAVLKNAVLKYNKPYGTTTLVDPKPVKTMGDYEPREQKNIDADSAV